MSLIELSWTAKNASNGSKKHFQFAFAPSRFPSKIQLLITEASSTSLLEELYRKRPALHGKPLPPQPEQTLLNKAQNFMTSAKSLASVQCVDGQMRVL